VAVYDLRGRRVRTLLDAERPVGIGEVAWDGRDTGGRALASGVYYVQVGVGSRRMTRKLTLVR